MSEDKKSLAMVVMSGDMDKLFGAFIIATGAAAMGMEVTMFFTFWGLRAIKKNVSTGKTFFGRMLGAMYGGDITKANPSKFSFGGMGRWMFGKMMGNHNVSKLVELRDLAVDLGVNMYGCQMSM
ncbi:MAG TPA: DsrE/DsrF/DrsH-like family protein, partial [Coriobacteriia bacterium]|nr:DsrE/DsrF/DrsH-like family protein [Coriobacteriia bacterium]